MADRLRLRSFSRSAFNGNKCFTDLILPLTLQAA